MIPPPPDDGELAAHQLAGLAALEAAVLATTHALVCSYPAVPQPPRFDDLPVVATARDLIDAGDRLLSALADHRDALGGHALAAVPDRPVAEDDDALF
jgi:hypothetical protein